MNKYKHIILLILIALFASDDLLAQRKKRATATSSHRGRFTNIKITHAKAKVVCPIFEESKYPYQGIGIKIGDPFALTYKFYASKKLSFAFDAGKAASGLYSGYHRDNFENLSQPDTLGANQGITYLGHIVNTDWFFEGKVLFQGDASKFLQGLQWYLGAGLQWRNPDIQYEYLLQTSFDRNEILTLDNSYLTMGPTVVFGIEYAYFNLPISAFMEVEWYTDISQDPGWQRFQGGVGIRVIF